MKVLALVDVETGEHTPLDAKVELARAGYQLVTLPGLGRLLVSPQGRIVRALRVAPVVVQEVADA